MVNDVAKNVLRIYAAIENQQENHQESLVELEGIISMKPISIFIDARSNISYVLPQIFESCSLQRKKHPKAGLLQ
jgi:hypothetical protein